MKMKTDTEWCEILDSLDIDESTVEVEGISVSVSQDSSSHSADVVQYLYVADSSLSFTRKGSKEISYDSWVDTHFSGWEVYE